MHILPPLYFLFSAALTGCPTQNHHPLFLGSGISYNWTDTAAGSYQTLSCSGLRLCQEMAGVSGGMIVRRCSAQAEWLMVDFSGCGLSVTTLHLCEVSQVNRSCTGKRICYCVCMCVGGGLAEYMWSHVFHIFSHSVQQIASDPESAAMVIVNITANASELGVSAISAATSIVEELTAAAIDQPEVCYQFTSS